MFFIITFMLISGITAFYFQYMGIKTDYEYLPNPQMRIVLFASGFFVAIAGTWLIPVDLIWFRLLFGVASGLSWAFAVPNQLKHLKSEAERRANKHKKD